MISEFTTRDKRFSVIENSDKSKDSKPPGIIVIGWQALSLP